MRGDPGRFLGYRARKREKFVPNLENPFSLERMGGAGKETGQIFNKRRGCHRNVACPFFEKDSYGINL